MDAGRVSDLGTAVDGGPGMCFLGPPAARSPLPPARPGRLGRLFHPVASLADTTPASGGGDREGAAPRAALNLPFVGI